MTNTEQFLIDMETNFPNHSFFRLELFSKGGDAKPISLKRDDIRAWNGIEKKNCIYYTPNGEYRLVNNQRRKINAQRMFSVFVELDFGSPEEKQKVWEGFEIQPSIVIETGKGYHVYRLIEPIQYSKEWDGVQDFLCGYFGGDRQAKDAARFLRVPGTTYWKDGKGDKTIEVIEYNIEKRYTIKDFLQFAAPFENVEKYERTIISGINKDARDIVDEINRTCDVVTILETLGSRWRVESNGAISEDNSITNGYKYWKEKNMLICFSDHTDSRPQGGPFSVAKFLLGSSKSAFEYFRNEYKIGVQQHQEKKAPIEDEGKKIISIEYESGVIQLDLNKGYTYADVYTKDGTKTVDVMSGAIKSLGYYRSQEDISFFIIYYKNSSGIEGYLTLSQLGKTSELEKKLSEVGIILFNCQQKNKIKGKIIEYICTTNNEYNFIDSAGGTGDGMYICKSGRYFAKKGNKNYYIDIERIGNESNVLFEVGKQIGKEEFMGALRRIQESYVSPISTSAMIWYMMSMFVKEIRMMFGFFPVLNFVGLTQSGKTTLRRSLMKYIGVSPNLELQAGTTEFVLMMMCKHSLPLSIGEFENSDKMRVDRDNFLKNNYDGTRNARGTAGLRMVTYPNASAIAIDGEIKSMNNAVNTRSIVLMMNPSFRGELIDPLDIYNINGYLIYQYNNIWKLGEVYKQVRPMFAEVLSESTISEKERIINNYSLLGAFAKLFDIQGVNESLKEQMKTQINTLGSSNVEKTIRLVFSMAILQNMPAYINDTKKTVVVETVLDSIKYQQKKIDELKSNIQVVNHHFNHNGGNMEDDLQIPLEYLMSNSGLHSIFVKILNYISRTKRFTTGSIGNTLKTFAEVNKYLDEPFYEDAKWTFSYPKKDVTPSNDLF